MVKLEGAFVKNGFVVVVLVTVGWAACMTRTGGTPPTEPRASEAQALAAPEDREQTDGGCAAGPCPDGGMGCLDIAVKQAQSGHKTFDPPPHSGWTMCAGQELVVDSALDEDLCVDLRQDNTPVAQTSLGKLSEFTRDLVLAGTYCLTICKPKEDRPCTEGCKNTDCSSSVVFPDTIRGNLDVITKVPDPIEDTK